MASAGWYDCLNFEPSAPNNLKKSCSGRLPLCRANSGRLVAWAGI